VDVQELPEQGSVNDVSVQFTWAAKGRVKVGIDEHSGLPKGPLGRHPHDDVGQIAIGVCDRRSHEHEI